MFSLIEYVCTIARRANDYFILFQGDKRLFDLMIRESSGPFRDLVEAMETHGGRPSVESENARKRLVAEE